MRFGLIDVLFLAGCLAVGFLLGVPLTHGSPKGVRLTLIFLSGLGLYVALIYPFYRGLRLFPMVLPWCPCCGRFQDGFKILNGVWPRADFQCPTCNGEFVVWLNGKPNKTETWTKPVLALKWPYAWGTYWRVNRPESDSGRMAGAGPTGSPG